MSDAGRVPFSGTVAYIDIPTNDKRMIEGHGGPWAEVLPLPVFDGPLGDGSEIGSVTQVEARTDEDGRSYVHIQGEVKPDAMPAGGTLEVAGAFSSTTEPFMDPESGLLVMRNVRLNFVVAGEAVGTAFPGAAIRIDEPTKGIDVEVVSSEEYVSVPTAFMNDKSLSPTAIALGILLKIGASPDGTFHARVEDIANGIGGKDVLKRCIHELETAGYIMRGRGYIGIHVHLERKPSDES